VSGDHRLASRAYGDGVATTPFDMRASGASQNEVGLVFAASSAICLVGLLPFRPWTWRFRRRRHLSDGAD